MSTIQTVQLNSSHVVPGRSNVLRLNFPYPFPSIGQSIALANLFIYYSWRNVTQNYGNNSCSYIFNGVSYPIVLPDGFYSVSDISSYIQFVMGQNGHYLLDDAGERVYFIKLEVNTVYYSVTLTCTPIPSSLPSGWSNPNSISLSGNCPLLNIDNAIFGKLIGFLSASYPAVSQTTTYMINSPIVPQISPTTSVSVNCSMVNNSKLNSIAPQSIYTFSANNEYSSQIQVQPQQLFWFRVVDSTYSYIEITLRDQDGRDLAVLDPNIVCTLLIK